MPGSPTDKAGKGGRIVKIVPDPIPETFVDAIPAIKRMVNEILDEKLAGFHYSGIEGPRLSQGLAGDIMGSLQANELIPRSYKVITHVTLGQDRGQGVSIASRGLWDPSTDNYVTVTRHDSSANFFISAVVFGVRLQQ